MKLCIEQKKDFDVRNFRVLIVQIKLMKKDFCKSQLWPKIAIAATNSTKKVIQNVALLSIGQARGTASQQRTRARLKVDF